MELVKRQGLRACWNDVWTGLEPCWFLGLKYIDGGLGLKVYGLWFVV